MYTIRMLNEERLDPMNELVRELRAAVTATGKFTAKICAPRLITDKKKLTRWSIEVPKVRLVELRLYCGNHPGECELGATRKSRCLEWDDWVEFHGVVNDVLDATTIVHPITLQTEVWSNPQDAKGRFWIRKNNERRMRYDWEEVPWGLRTMRIWNTGTPDQFEEGV